MTFREAIDRKPPGLDARHETVARVLISRPEGVTRDQTRRLADMDERAFRERCEEITASGWLPVIVDHRDGPNKPGWYRIAQAHEAPLVDQEARQHHGRAVSLHKRSRGLVEAFRNTHSAGGLFLTEPEPLEAV